MSNSLCALLQFIFTLRGWYRYCILAVLGGLLALAFPPFHALYILPLILPLYFGMTVTARGFKEAFLTGWSFGFGHHIVGIYWIAFSLLTDFASYFWLIPFSIFGLAAILALYFGVTSWVTFGLPVRPFGKITAFIFLWVAGEMFRGYMLNFFTLYGFPWNLIGNVWSHTIEMTQAASLVGVYGLSILTLLVAVLPALYLPLKTHGLSSVRFGFLPMLLSLVILLTWYFYGAMRSSDIKLTYHEGVTLRLVQPNVSEHHRWIPQLRLKKLIKHLELTQKEGLEEVTHIIWPESAIPLFVDANVPWLKMVEEIIPDEGALLAGSFRIKETPKTEIWTSMFVFEDAANVDLYYDKIRLVPLGEYIPHRKYLPFQNIYGSIDFSKGPGPRTLPLPNAPSVGPLICYDAIFPQSVIEEENPPAWLLNITNDAWFEFRTRPNPPFYQLSTGPYQHFAMTRMRAVEQGLPLIRVANTGITAVIDAYGRVLQHLPLGAKGIIDSPLPMGIVDQTLYRRYGSSLPLIMLGLLAMITFFSYRKVRNM